MASNDEIILQKILYLKQQEVSPNISASEFFEIFVADQLLKNYDLSDEEIEDGITGKGDDGGIDSMYTFLNGKLVVEDTDVSQYKKIIEIELFIIQSKTSNSFTEIAVQKLEDTTLDILDLSKSLDSMILYNQEILKVAGYFRSTYEKLILKFPQLSISYFYVTQGDTQKINPKVIERTKKLENAVKSLWPKVKFNFSFIGARELIRLASTSSSTSLQMQLLENPIATKKGGYSCLVSLQEYYKFITDSDGHLRKNLFEANVRDYEGDVEVNQDIRRTLQDTANEDFWWLNNGVTIIADKGSVSSKTLTLENSQVVNGLQTSMEIYAYFKHQSIDNEERSVLVKVITTEEPASRDKIIKATNRQTTVPLASLRATDEIQRDIEQFFLNHDLYYDRRKNFYKNQGKPKDKIISITYLAQVVMSILFQEPDIARGRPSSLLKKQDDYEKVFNKSYPIQIYLNCVMLMKKVKLYIKEYNGLNYEEKSNLKFHTAMYVAISKLGKVSYKPEELEKIDLATIDETFLQESFLQVVKIFREHRNRTKKAADVAAKSKDLVKEILEDLSKSL